MSIKAQKYKELIDSAMEVMELQAATELVQSMEARGDFKYKGIFRVFNSVMDWTGKFSSNGILPTREQISRENELELDRVKYYLQELVGKPDSRMVVAMPAVDFVGGAGAELLRFIVYCRPGKNDTASAMKYYNAYQEKNAKAISNWLSSRPVKLSPESVDLIYERIEQGKLPDTQDGAEIARNFYSELDTTPEKKRNTYAIFARPIIQKLIESHQLIYLATREGAPAQYKAIFYNNMDHLQERFRILAGYFLENIYSGSPISEVSPATINDAIKSVISSNFNSLSAGYKQTVLELMILIPTLGKLKQEKEEQDKQKDLEKIISDLSKKPGIVEMQRLKIRSEEIRGGVIRSNLVLYAEFPVNGRLTEYVLHTNSIELALKSAGDRLEKLGDDTELLILSAMGIERQLDNEKQKLFHEMEQKALFNRLPWYKKLWRALTGRLSLKPEESAKMKSQMNKSIEEEKLRVRTIEARREQKRLVSERMKDDGSKQSQTDSVSSTASDSVTASPSLDSPDDTEEAALSEKTEEALKAEETLKKIILELDHAWERREFPNREFLLTKLSGFDEDALILFLKKYGRKEIYSFRINHDKPEYRWPILITRRYLRQNAKKMLSKAMADADEQRNAMMPNQEKFDIATSMEDFLNRVLNKS